MPAAYAHAVAVALANVQAAINEAAASAGIAPEALRAALAGPIAAPRPQQCPRCGGTLRISGSARLGHHQVRRLVCSECGFRLKSIVAAEAVHRRRRRRPDA